MGCKHGYWYLVGILLLEGGDSDGFDALAQGVGCSRGMGAVSSIAA